MTADEVFGFRLEDGEGADLSAGPNYRWIFYCRSNVDVQGRVSVRDLLVESSDII